MSETISVIERIGNHPKVATFLTVGAFALSGCGDKGGAPEKIQPATATCEQVSGFADDSANPAEFGSQEFLPIAPKGIDNPEEVEDYIYNNPVEAADKIDPASLAALMSAVTKPASDRKATDSSYDYVEAFKESLDGYAAGVGALEKAKQDCEQTVETLKQVAEYNGSWAQEGEKVVKLSAVRDETNKIVGMELKKQVVTETLSGVELKLRETSSEDLDGFTSVLITEEGEMYVKGVIVERNARNNKDRKDKGGSKDNKRSQTGKGKSPTGGSQKESGTNKGGPGGPGGDKGRGGNPGGDGPGCRGVGKGCPGEGPGPGGPGGPGSPGSPEQPPVVPQEPGPGPEQPPVVPQEPTPLPPKDDPLPPAGAPN